MKLQSLTLISLVSVACAAACSSSSSGDGSSTTGAGGTTGSGGTGGSSGSSTVNKSVKVASWWQAPGEAEAIHALISTFETKNAGYKVKFDLISDGDTARAQLQSELTDPVNDPPPDVAQYNANNVPTLLTSFPDALTTLDSAFTAASLNSTNVPPEILAAVTVNAHIYSIPLNIHRENMFFYNTTILSANNIAVPTTVDELLIACPKLKAASITPVVTSYQGWIQRIMFNSIAAGAMGASKFHDFMTGKTAFTDTAWSDAIDKYTAVLDACVDDATAKDTTNYGWTQAADDLYQGKGAFFYHGDWAKGYLVSRGFSPGTDFGGVGSPGAKDLFWFGVDVLILPKQAVNPAGAALFFDTATSIDGQVAFNKAKGSTPFRTDVPSTSLDAIGALTQADFKATGEVRMLVNTKDAWDTALGNYAATRDKAALLKAYTDNPVVAP
jgi:glucose/mannose transport system substrate-binding protein